MNGRKESTLILTINSRIFFLVYICEEARRGEARRDGRRRRVMTLSLFLLLYSKNSKERTDDVEDYIMMTMNVRCRHLLLSAQLKM